MSGQTWPQIKDFARIFNGAGHTISNLNVTGDSDIGFIGHLSGGTVKNLLLVNATSNGVHSIGGITGRLSSEGTVIACAVSGCTVNASGGMAGGIAGQVGDSGSVTACYAASCSSGSVTACYAASCSVTGASVSFGQIACIVDGSITACYYDGDGIDIGSGDVTQVTGDITWQAAAEAMNKQLADNDYIWEVNTEEATKDDFPLALVPNPDVQ